MLEHQMDVSKNSGTPKSSILIGCSIINHQFWGTLIFGNTQISPLLITFFGFRPFSVGYLCASPLRHLLATGLKEFELSNAECRNDFDREFIYSGIIQWYLGMIQICLTHLNGFFGIIPHDFWNLT